MITPEETAELKRLLAVYTRKVKRNEPFYEQDGAGMALDRALRNHAPALLAAARQAEAKDARIAELESALRSASSVARQDRRIAAFREAVSMLHDRAKMMHDPHARSVIDSAALYVGERAARLADPSPNAGGGGA